MQNVLRSHVGQSLTKRLSPQMKSFSAYFSTNLPEGADRGTSSSSGSTTHFDESQLDSLVCPLSKGKLRWDPAASELVSDEINVAYPVVNGVPQLTPEKGRVLSGPVKGADADEIPAQPS